MSKGSLKKFRKNDYNDDNEYNVRSVSNYVNRKKEKRIDHALRTKNIDELLEAQDGYDPIDSDDEIWHEWE